MKQKIIAILGIFLMMSPLYSQQITEILGRPTLNSITVSLVSDQPTEFYYEYGTLSGALTSTSQTYYSGIDTAVFAKLVNLNPDTKYYYRCQYRVVGSGSSFQAGTEHSFHTSRTAGSHFCFAIEADPHLDTNSNFSAYSLTLQNILGKQPDFLIDLGDNFMSEKQIPSSQANITARHLLYRPYFGSVCHSVPLYLALGNHEGEQGWKLNGDSTSVPVLCTKTRKILYPNPLPDGFYSGDTIPQMHTGLRGDYYAWNWGNVLLVVLDPYWYTLSKPGWGWTLGEDQYFWLKDVLENSQASYKFVFCHQIIGGDGSNGRGGAEYVPFWEMGGNNADTIYEFDTYRPGWIKPIHQLLVDNHVHVWFHGHDHFFGKQEKDGVIYQEVPQPSTKNISNIPGLQYGYQTGDFLPNRGFLLVSVGDSSARIDYIKTYLPQEENATRHNGDTAFTYTLTALTTGVAANASPVLSSELKQLIPNPFSSLTLIYYSLSKREKMELLVYDMFGRQVCLLEQGYKDQGDYTFSFDPGKYLPKSGIYFCRLATQSRSSIIKMIYVR